MIYTNNNHKNLSLINTKPKFEYKDKYDNSVNWNNFCNVLPQQKWVKEQLYSKQKGICAFCNKKLKENFVVHHKTYDFECVVKDKTTNLPCQKCNINKTCFNNLALVCKVCNLEMQHIIEADEKLPYKRINSMDNITQNIQIFETLLRQVNRQGIDKAIKYVQDSDFYNAPASSRFHLSVQGGLLQHSLNVFYILKSLLKQEDYFNYNYEICGNKIASIPYESVIISALLHDICKTNFYVTEKRNKKIDGRWQEVDFYTVDDKCPYGHGEKSVMMLEQFLTLTKQERMAIRWHMGMPDDWAGKNSYWAAVEMYPFILALHTADVAASKFIETTETNKFQLNNSKL